MKRKLIIAVSGASGALYAKRIFFKLNQLSNQIAACGIIMSNNARQIWLEELSDDLPVFDFPFRLYGKTDFSAPFASGSAQYETMIVIPASMGLIGRIACGISDDLATRAADVILKERRKLILVPRETPFSLIHLRNLTATAEAGAIICPASPSFYHKPQTIEQLADTVVDRVLDLAGFDIQTKRWNDV